MSKYTGGPAFPLPWAPRNEKEPMPPMPPVGMTLRDYFAAKAMQGIQAANGNASIYECQSIVDAMGGVDAYIKHVATSAYQYADAMLEARK